MHDIALTAALVEDHHRAFPVVHEAGSAIDLIAAVGQKMTQTVRKAPLDIRLGHWIV